MIELSIGLQTDKRLDEYRELAQIIEAYDFHTLTVYEDLMFQPAWQPLHVMAQCTDRIRLGPAIVSPYLRHPAIIAGEFALLNEAAEGRAYLGLGRGAFLDALDLSQPKPITAVRETAEIVQRLLRGDRTPYEGHVFSATEEAYFRWRPSYNEASILIGTWGPKMAALAGEIADEVKVGGCWNPAFMEIMRSYIARGAHAVDRDPGQIGLVVGAVTVVDEDPKAAEALARREVAMYLPVVIGLDPTLEVDEKELAAVEAASAQGDLEAAANAISIDTLRKLACFGTPEEIIRQIELFAETGASRIEFGTPHGQDEAAAIRLLGERVLPYFSN